MAEKNHSVVSHRSQVQAGMRFGKLTVISPLAITQKGKKRRWLCVCDCGNQTTVYVHNLRYGCVKTCGCGSRGGRRQEKHGRSYSAEYRVWSHIQNRCHNPTSKSYKDYGKRGIYVCERWRKSFSAFLEDMGERPSPRHEIDRIDNDGNYEPGNCRWLLKARQARNRRSNRLLTYQGETLCLAEWAERTGINPGTLHSRIRYGWPADKILTTPK